MSKPIMSGREAVDEGIKAHGEEKVALQEEEMSCWCDDFCDDVIDPWWDLEVFSDYRIKKRRAS